MVDADVQTDIGVIMEVVIPVCRQVDALSSTALSQSVGIQRGVKCCLNVTVAEDDSFQRSSDILHDSLVSKPQSAVLSRCRA